MPTNTQKVKHLQVKLSQAEHRFLVVFAARHGWPLERLIKHLVATLATGQLEVPGLPVPVEELLARQPLEPVTGP